MGTKVRYESRQSAYSDRDAGEGLTGEPERSQWKTKARTAEMYEEVKVGREETVAVVYS
jgi:hypothetical protein